MFPKHFPIIVKYLQDPNLLKLRSLDPLISIFLGDAGIWGQWTQMLQMLGLQG